MIYSGIPPSLSPTVFLIFKIYLARVKKKTRQIIMEKSKLCIIVAVEGIAAAKLMDQKTAVVRIGRTDGGCLRNQKHGRIQ